MAATPSIKGSVFATAVEDVNKLLAEGQVSRAEASRWLLDAEFGLLEQEIRVASWYDVRSYHNLNRLLRDVEGGGSNEYLREKGRATARRLGEMGLYSQLEYLQRTRVAGAHGQQERFDAFGRDLSRLNTLSASIYNFSKWKGRPDPDHPLRYVLEVTEAGPFPETALWRSDGFINEMAKQHNRDSLWTWERPRPDLILFHMTGDI